MKNVLVLMSTYNGQKYIKEQIDSILSQRNVNVYLLIRDDGSSDNTVNILKEYESSNPVIDVIYGHNVGFATSFMMLLFYAYDKYYSRFDYCAFSDQDDVWLQDKMINAVNKLENLEDTEYRKINVVYSNAKVVDENLNFMFMMYKNQVHLYSKYNMLTRYFVLGCTMVMPKHTVSFLTKYKPIGKLQMHDLWISQTCSFFGNLIYDDDPQILYRQHSNNAAGVSFDIKVRILRFIKSFKMKERRHFRENNARVFLNTYNDILSNSDKKILELIVSYRESIYNRFKLLLCSELSMGIFLSDVIIKLRILFGFF